MNIYQVNKVMSDKTKARIVTHFWNCKCLNLTVCNLIEKIGTTQSNISKHLSDLKTKGILNNKKQGREKYYLIDEKWKQKWKDIIDIQTRDRENIDYLCNCNRS